MQINEKDLLLLNLHPIMITEKYKTLITTSKYYILKLYLMISIIYTLKESCITSVNKTITNSWKKLKKKHQTQTI